MQSSVELERDTEVSDGADEGESVDDDAQTGGRLTRLKNRLARIFSPRRFLLAVVLVAVGVAAGGFVGDFLPLLGTVGRILGVFAAMFLLGLGRSRRQYLEVAAAGATVAVLVVLSSTLSGAFLPVGVEVLQDYGLAIAGIGAGSGAGAAVLGYYFGRDLRAGLTKSI